MKYLYILFEAVEYWLEIDSDSYAIRQINIEPDRVEISAFHDCLSETRIIKEELDGDIQMITSDEFETQWNSIIDKYRNLWEEAKSANSIGMTASGKVACFYPQGTVIEIGNVRGLYLHTDNVNVGQIVQGMVDRYDETNMWIVLSETGIRDEFTNKILFDIEQNSNDLLLIRESLIKFKNKGMDKDFMLECLESIRALIDSKAENILLDLMDFVTGFCSQHMAVFDN